MTGVRADDRPATHGKSGIVLEHALVREGLRRVLTREPQFRVVADSATGPEARDLVLRHRPALVVLDLELSDRSDPAGLQLCRQLTSSKPGSHRARGRRTRGVTGEVGVWIEEYAQLGAMIAEHDYLNGEVIRFDGALRMQPR
jgi:hypothetical protein